MLNKDIVCKCCHELIQPSDDFIIHETVGDNWREECICASCCNDIYDLIDNYMKSDFWIGSMQNKLF